MLHDMLSSQLKLLGRRVLHIKLTNSSDNIQYSNLQQEGFTTWGDVMVGIRSV